VGRREHHRRPGTAALISAANPIKDLDELRNHLQYAIGLELTTIPAYLCALYTIEQETNSAAYEVIQSVVLEEMLHMALAANVLNAIGGVPSTAPVGDGPSPVPRYPTKVRFIERIPTIHLQPFSPQAIDEFIAIEQPDDAPAATDEKYGSIGTFYAAIEDGIRDLCTPEVFAAARVDRAGCQLAAHQYYGGAGTLLEVTGQESALAALEETVREGEGVPSAVLAQTAQEHLTSAARTPGRLRAEYKVEDLDELPFGWKMYSHYARFKEIRTGRYYRPDQVIGEPPAGDVLPTDWRAVRPMVVDPTSEAYRGTAAHAPMVAFNSTYTHLVDTVYRSFNGKPDALRTAVHVMYQLKEQANALLNTPCPRTPGRTLGPAFEYIAQPL
jgi:Ferritin-like